ncbi:MAG: GIY-YIG nuclease family protein [Bacillota bacterium]
MEQTKRRREFGREMIMGVYSLVNTVTGRMLIGNSLHFNSHYNRMRTELRLGVYRHRPLQEDWKKYGEEAFRFDILEEYLPQDDEDFPAIVTALEALEEKWAEKLGAHPQYTRVRYTAE